MSEAKDESKSDRSTLSWEDRLAVVDYLRALRAPLVFEQKAAAAAHVSTESKVEINWSQLKYLMEQFPKLKLEEKFVFGDESAITNISLLETRIIALESFLAQAVNDIGGLKARVAQLEGAQSSLI